MPEFARRIAPLAGFRNVLLREYIQINWDLIYANLPHLDDLAHFRDEVRRWLAR